MGHGLKVVDYFLEAGKLAVQYGLVVQLLGYDALAFVFPVLQGSDVEEVELRCVCLFRPEFCFLPVVVAGLVVGFCLL